MKTIISFIVSLLFLLAAQNEIGINPESAVLTINDLFGNKLQRDITANDIDFSKIVKIYVDTNVFEIPSNKLSDVLRELENGEYMYELPVRIDSETVVLSITKGRPLSENVSFTEKEREEILANEGKWQITAFALDPDYKTYDEILTIPDNTTYILVTGLPYFMAPAALIVQNGEITAIIPTEGFISEFSEFSLNEYNVYDYNAVKNYILEHP